jgi:hypothetical protein
VTAILFEGMSGGGDGSMVNANIPLTAAATAPTTKAGGLPPPKRASHGPLATDTNICKNIIKPVIELNHPLASLNQHIISTFFFLFFPFHQHYIRFVFSSFSFP